MKSSKILLQSDKSNIEETPKKVSAVKLLRFILVIFMFSGIMLLSSCFVGAPRHSSSGVIIEHHDNDRPRDNDRHHDNGKHRGQDKHHDNDRHQD